MAAEAGGQGRVELTFDSCRPDNVQQLRVLNQVQQKRPSA